MDEHEPIPMLSEVRPQPPPAVSFSLVRVLVVTAGLVTIGLVLLFAAPWLMLRWWQAEAQADVDAAYRMRQAELKAEAEAADARLAAIDRRVELVSLGFRQVARKVAPAVVAIASEVERKNPGNLPFDFDEGTERTYVQQSEGSGIIVKPGFILTNYHVVRNAQRLRLTFANDEQVPVEPSDVSVDVLTDLAVIRVPLKDKTGHALASQVVAEFADSDKDVQVGDWVLAVGSPFGLKQSVTAGIISAKGRVALGILDYVDLLQTDAAVNPGNSGGPLFDQKGRLVGINVAIASKTGGNQGIAFAIPSNTALEIFNELIEHGEVVRGFLGIGLQEMPRSLERRMGLTATGGVFVSFVQPNSPAQAAGIHFGDVVVRYNQEPVGPANALHQLRQRIAQTQPGTTVSIEIMRGRQRQSFEVTIGKRPQQ